MSMDNEELMGQGGDEGMSAADSPSQETFDGDGEVVSQVEAPVSQQATASEWQSILDFARQQGVQLPAHDDRSATQILLDAYRQAQQRNWYADFGRQVAPYADQVQAWIAQQRQAQQQPAQRNAWEPPEWNPAWINMVERDQSTGLIYAKPGVDPSVADKVRAYAEWQDKFRENPAQMIQPLVEHRARALIQEEFAQQRQSYQADSIVQQNAAWMFQTQPNGAPVLMQDGSRALSPAGQLYARSVNDIWNTGVRDVNKCHQLALGVVQNAVLRQQWLAAQHQAAVSHQQIEQASVPTNVGGSATRPSVSPKRGPQDQKGLSLRERLNSRLSGMTDNEAGF